MIIITVGLLLTAGWITFLETTGPSDCGAVHMWWTWYNSIPSGVDSGVLTGIAGVSAVVWTGGLVAFTLKKRLTANLSNGMWMLVFAFVTPLIALIASGAVLRTTAIVGIILFGTIAVPQLALSLGFYKRRGKMVLSATMIDGSTLPMPTEKFAELLGDMFDRVIFGGILTGLVTLMCLGIVVYASTTIVAAESLALLILGSVLIYQVLTSEYWLGNENKGLFATRSATTSAQSSSADVIPVPGAAATPTEGDHPEASQSGDGNQPGC